MNEIVRFFTEHEDVAPKDIPPEVIKKAAGGASLGEAYALWENNKLREENEALRKNAENAAKAAPSSKGAGKAAEDIIDVLWEEE